MMMMMMVSWKKHHLLSLLTAGADQLYHGISTFVTTLVALPADEASYWQNFEFFLGDPIASSKANVPNRSNSIGLTRSHANSHAASYAIRNLVC